MNVIGTQEILCNLDEFADRELQWQAEDPRRAMQAFEVADCLAEV
jgi:hypothetical protein